MLAPEGTPPPHWALAFDQWLADAIERRDLADLSAFPGRPKDARIAHPTPEHLLPLFVALGAGWAANRSSRLHQSWSYGSLSMSAYAFGTRLTVQQADRFMLPTNLEAAPPNRIEAAAKGTVGV